ncbi:hypothetical protein GUITHDRAFT_145787 [Guillardia theta CCMP2712]|uniref:Uncharacterized protein n=1 Tax=Guillardia theta (strain CCMP2712) TaxID=905079 RepID=L1IKV4_GUITC|nr:hypothetical protein GUITHDRAFT_145787 [Guillardia theta CCMP2712]EKX36425.1 hypothetical protein GUITHDRAFT_145787 [Guillardia theta CCMP2712]|eukprot:XP_005823405.1 hypothetical protein GUITHDRAFT_145787 [Guillardia theta CCMP2712]
MNLTGRTDFYAIHSKMYYELPPSLASRPETSSYSCGIDQCFCGYWGFSGHMCTPAEESCRCAGKRGGERRKSEEEEEEDEDEEEEDEQQADEEAEVKVDGEPPSPREFLWTWCDVCHAQHDCKFVLNVLNMNAMDDYQGA